MPSFLHARGSLFTSVTVPEEGTMRFEGPAFEKFTQTLDQKLEGMVGRWIKQAAPIDRQESRANKFNRQQH